MIILSLTNHNESSASLHDTKKKITYAASEERFTRIKNSSGMPLKTIDFLLKKRKISINKVDQFVYCSHESILPTKQIQKDLEKEKNTLNEYDKQVFEKRIKAEIKFNKKYIDNFNKWIKKNKVSKNKISFMDHHEAHARSAIICQKKSKGFIITADGKGGFTSSAIWKFDKKKITCVSRNSTFNSLGYLYGNVTIGLGYKAERHEGKITGLSSYGKIQKKISFNKVFSVIGKKIFARNLKQNFIPFFLRGKNYWDVSQFTKDIKKYPSKDVAATVQNLLEKILVKYVKKNIPKNSNLLLAGGIFANVKLNRKIKKINLNRYLYVAPPMSDMGLCLGGIHKLSKNNLIIDNMYLGPKTNNDKIIKELKKDKKIGFKIFENKESLNKIITNKLLKNQIIGIFNGSMEFGPRALCNRSIIFTAKKKKLNDIVNKRLNRTEFMPFAPVCMDKFSSRSFAKIKKWDYLSKFMTVTYKCKKYFLQNYPAACHVDRTARPQILYKKDNPWFYNFLQSYYNFTGQTCVMNTSFNNHEEPIVCYPRDAIKSLQNKNVDCIIFNGKILVFKNK